MRTSVFSIVLAGVSALAVAMGLGRFGFTPLAPMMQADAGLTLEGVGWLASANYLGYFLGAQTANSWGWPANRRLGAGLILVVIATALMGLTHSLTGWLAYRLIAGVASAWAFVSASVLALARLADMGAARSAGLIFTGVGFGIAFAGLFCMILAGVGASSDAAWLMLAGAAIFGSLLTIPLLRETDFSSPRVAAAQDIKLSGKYNYLIICYGLFGFGYILPATYLPAQAKMIVSDPLYYGLSWPIFGSAAVLSTLAAVRWLNLSPRRNVWSFCQLIMAFGLLAPLWKPGLGAILLASLCVGGTFMVLTMVALQEARALAGSGAQRLIAHMTTAFALGQLAGPIVANLLAMALGDRPAIPLGLAALGLILSSFVLQWTARREKRNDA